MDEHFPEHPVSCRHLPSTLPSTFGGWGGGLGVLGSDILCAYRSPSHQPHHDPTQHPRNRPETDPERTRNGAKQSQTEPNGAKRSQNGPKSSPLGWDGRGGLSGWGGVGVVREKKKRISLVLGFCRGLPHSQILPHFLRVLRLGHMPSMITEVQNYEGFKDKSKQEGLSIRNLFKNEAQG